MVHTRDTQSKGLALAGYWFSATNGQNVMETLCMKGCAIAITCFCFMTPSYMHV